MEDRSTAAVHYDDMTGTVAIDGFDGPFLTELGKRARMPAGYTPIGFCVDGHNDMSVGRETSLTLIALDVDLSGVGGDALSEYFANKETIHAFEFELQIPLEGIVALMKQYQIVVYLREIEGKKVVILDDR